MIDLSLQNYIDWYVKPVMKIKEKYGYRVVLKYQDGSVKIQQKSGFETLKEAKTERDKTVAELYNGRYVVYADVIAKEYFDFWLEEKVKKTSKSYNTYYSYSGVIKNHIIPALGKKKMAMIGRGDIQKLYCRMVEYSISVAKQVKTIVNMAFAYALEKKVIQYNVAQGVDLPKKEKENAYHSRFISTRKTLTLEQIDLLIKKSKGTSIYMQVLFNVLMGMRRSEIIAVKYSDVDYVNRTLNVVRQLGRKPGSEKKDYPAKTLTKQEIKLKTQSSMRKLPIPDYVFEAILQEKQLYEKKKKRRGKQFQDLGYVCCSDYGRPRSKDYHWKHYKKLLRDCGLPDIRWHDLRSTYCTLLLKNNFSPKAVSKLMGHATELITMDVYGDNGNILSEGIPELDGYLKGVLPEQKPARYCEELLDVVIDVSEYLFAG